MSSFQVPVKRIRAIEAHPNADAIEFAVVDGYRSIVRKGDFASGELVAYIPESSIVPEAVIRRLGLWDAEKGKGKLSGGGKPGFGDQAPGADQSGPLLSAHFGRRHVADRSPHGRGRAGGHGGRLRSQRG